MITPVMSSAFLFLNYCDAAFSYLTFAETNKVVVPFCFNEVALTCYTQPEVTAFTSLVAEGI